MFELKSIRMAVASVALFGLAVMPAMAQRRIIQRRPPINQRTWEIRSLVDAAERTSNSFRDAVERRDRNTNTPRRYGTTYRERYFNDLAPQVRRLDEAFERLRSVADNRRPRAGRDEMTRVLTAARSVNRYFSSYSYGWGGGNRYNYMRSSDLDARWRDLKRDINALARAYNMATI